MHQVLPSTLQELTDKINATKLGGSESDEVVYAAARELGALKHCLICSTDIIDEESFVQEALGYYGVDGDQLGLQDALASSGVEVGTLDHTDTCAYHQHVASRD